MEHIKIAKVPNSLLLQNNELPNIGTIHITPHHLLFIGDKDRRETWIAYALIYCAERRAPTTRIAPPTSSSVDRQPNEESLEQVYHPLIVRCRNFLQYVFLLPSEKEVCDLFDSVQKLGCIAGYNRLHAFSYQPFPKYTSTDGWTVYNPEREFARMGVGSKTDAWRLSTVNSKYTLCSTYPSVFVVPSRISDIVLNYAAKYRSKGRIPALSYLHRNTLASITRCSQPMVGLKQARSIQDEKLIEAIFASNASPGGLYGSTSANLLIDARPTANALANVAKGAGTENMENYKGCNKVYLGIDNIHVMRESLARMIDATEVTNTSKTVNRDKLVRSGWLKHIKNLLDGVALIVKHVYVYSSHVVVHCSDGWDRTSQLVSLAEICLDPYYRTIRGLQVLIEKDWVSFGHKFGDRQGHITGERQFLVNINQELGGEKRIVDNPDPTNSQNQNPSTSGNTNAFSSASAFAGALQSRFDGVRAAASGSLGNLGMAVGSGVSGGPGTVTHGTAKETSPVFHQFLDAIYQIWTQYPTRFEYDETLLIALHTHSYSCQYGNFLFNTERERMESSATSKTQSIWDMINSNLDEFKNPMYVPSDDDGEDSGVLIPETTELRYWSKIFHRKDEELNAPPMSAKFTPTQENPSFVSNEYANLSTNDSTSNVALHAPTEQVEEVPVSQFETMFLGEDSIRSWPRQQEENFDITRESKQSVSPTPPFSSELNEDAPDAEDVNTRPVHLPHPLYVEEE